MKEKIYTIPLNDSFDIEHGCPFCYLENKLERALVEYTLGPSMMEPDSREKSNAIGFCKNHLNLMLKENKRLSLALMLSTHLEHIQNKLNDLSPEEAKSGIFKKNPSSDLTLLGSCTQGCVICNGIEQDMQRYIKVFFYMWDKEADFRKKVDEHRHLCVCHGIALLENMPPKHPSLKAQIIKLMQTSLTDNITELKAYINMFDYRSEVTDPSRYKDAVPNAVSILRGKTENP